MTNQKAKLLVVAAALTLQLTATGQSGFDAASGLSHASHLIIPQSRSFQVTPGTSPIQIELVQARISILEQSAHTTLDISLRNPSANQAEAILLLPVPDGAAISEFAFAGDQPGSTARLLTRNEARRLYDDIVAKLSDPALLEFAGYNLIRSSVFPIEPGGTQRIQIEYDHLLDSDGERIDYVLPRSESLDQSAPWDIHVDVRSKTPIATTYSPSHSIVTTRNSDQHLSVRLGRTGTNEPGPFLLSYLVERKDGVNASLFTYPDASVGGGYFLLLAGVPPRTDDARSALKREVTIVLDRSGSMAGPKMDQARIAAAQVLERLRSDEAFNIIDYSTTVSKFAVAPVTKSRDNIEQARSYLADVLPGGGTNIHGALLEALKQEPTPGMLPIVLFLTDGLPTVGPTSEVDIRGMVRRENTHNRRVFTFGVGHDVNVPLLDFVAESTRATTTYVLPDEDVEVKVARAFKKLYGPVLSDTALATLNANNEIETRRVHELHPLRMPDLFENDQLVVLGQYRGNDPLRFRLAGNYLGNSRIFEFEFSMCSGTTRNTFVPRLWASRRMAYLIDQVRQAGATSNMPAVVGADPFSDPRMRELREEILHLSTRFGVLSEYTAFLATEGTRLSDWHSMVVTCGTELNDKAMQTRSGIGAVNQGANIVNLKGQRQLNRRNFYLDNKLNRVEVSSVQQVHDRAFFRRGNRWVDGRSILSGDLEPSEVINYGTDEHLKLLQTLIQQHRNGVLSLSGEILIRMGDKNILVVNGGC